MVYIEAGPTFSVFITRNLDKLNYFTVKLVNECICVY
jgi:hypothetical protein